MEEQRKNSYDPNEDIVDRMWKRSKNSINLVIVVCNILVFLAVTLTGGTESSRHMMDCGAAYAPLIESGEYYRLFTSMFLHFGIQHLINNMLLLLFLGDYLERAVGKIRYLVNDLLLYLSNLRSIFVPINKHGAQGKNNARLIDEAYASENQIVTFPAGLCSRKINGQIQDTDWKKSFIQKAVEHQRDVVPVYFEGRNSNFFYRLANLRKRLGIKMNYEMIYLPDEMFRSKHKTFRIHFGKPVPWQTFDSSKKPAEWAEWVKGLAYNLRKT